jgi:PAS domain S-box-containing protein
MSGSRAPFVRIAGALAFALTVALSLTAASPLAFAQTASATASSSASAEPTIAPAAPGTLLFLGNEKIAPVIFREGSLPAGLAVDLVRALQEHMSQPVEIRAMDWKQAQTLVAQGRADALIQINSTPERAKIYDFSEPFLESHFSIFVRSNQTGISGVASLRGLRVGVESGGLPQQILGRDAGISLKVIPNFPEGFRMLEAGTIDAVVVDFRVGSYVLATEHISNIKTAGEPIASSYSSIAVRKGNTTLLAEINSALREIRADGTYQRIIASWAPTEGVFETQEQISERMFLATIVALLILLAIAVAWAVTLLRQMKRKRVAEEALRVSERKLALHLQQNLLGVIETDMVPRVVEWNPAAEAIFGYSREEAIGRTAAELLVPESGLERMESIKHDLLSGKGGRFETNECRTKDGRIILCEWVNTPLTDDSGQITGVMCLVRDVTEQRRVEQARVAEEAAEAAGIAKSVFLANMSHEIRTPMNAILGFSQIMKRDKGLSARQLRQLDIISSSGEHLLALVNDVLEMSKVEAGRIAVNRAAFDLHAMIEEMETLFGLRTQAKGIEWSVACAPDLPRFVITDPNKLRQVLVNLLGNAVKFTDAGKVELRVGVVRETGGELRLTVQVADTGCGIEPEDMDKLFRFFEQVQVSHAAETGTGLGLAISREFVRLLGGEITVESSVGVGSTFRFEIPIEEAAAEETPSAPSESRVVGLYPDEPSYRVLVADDAPDNRELLVQLLQPIGFTVREASNGQEALRAFEEWRPQLILMDMRMPVMDGYEATRRIRSTPAGSDVAIIGVTASALGEMAQGVFDAGVDEFVVKPIREGEVLDKIGRLLGARYVYEERLSDEWTDADVLDPDAVAAIPRELRARIAQAAASADFAAVLSLADEVAPLSEPSATALRSLADRFDAESILTALRGSGS